MKNILFSAVLILLFAYGYYLMCKLDKSILKLREPTKINMKDTNKNIHVVVLGKTTLATTLVEIFVQNGYNCRQIEYESQVDINQNYEYLFASSDKDLDNLMFCVFAKRYMNVKKIIVICNQLENRKIFDDCDETYYLKDEVSAKLLFESAGFRTAG